MIDEYTVRRYPHGVAIFGASVPLPDLTALMRVHEKRGLTLICTGIASAIGASFVFSDEDGRVAWTAEIDTGISQKPPLERWLAGTTTGTSSLTMVQVITGRVVLHGDRRPNVPLDPSDFRRCMLLLEAVPELREGLPKVAEAYPAWVGLVDHWGELEALWTEEAPTRRCPKLYARIQELTQ